MNTKLLEGMTLAKLTCCMGDTTLQTRLIILAMVGIFIGACIGAVCIARSTEARQQVRSPDPFQVSAQP